MAWSRRCVGLFVAAAVIGGCAGDSGDPEGFEGTAAASAGEATSTGAAESTSGDPSSGGTAGAAEGTSTTDMPAQCEDGDDGWGTGGEDGDGDGDGSGGGTFGMDDDMPLATNVYDVQMGTVGPGELVAISGLVATTPATLTETGTGWEMFVQEPTGGPYSGIRLRIPTFDPSELVAPGDEVALVGRLREQDGFYLIEIVGSGSALTPGAQVALPEPDVVPAEMLEPTSELARQYEGVPVRVEEVVVVDADPCEGEFAVGEALRVDDRFVEDGLPKPAQGAVIVAVEGVLVYAFDAYELAPTSASGVE